MSAHKHNANCVYRSHGNTAKGYWVCGELIEEEVARLRAELKKAREEVERMDHAYNQLHCRNERLQSQVRTLVEVLDSPALLEKLAAQEHERWSGWMEYQERAPEWNLVHNL